MTRPALLAVPTLFVTLVLAWIYWPASTAGQSPADSTATPISEAPDEGNTSPLTDWASRGDPSRFTSGLEELPASLDGTRVPDGLRTDSNGNLVVSLELRDVFDYFLSVIGEEDMDTIVARLRAYLNDQLPAGAAAEANQILNSYLALRKSLSDLPGTAPAGESLDIAAVRAQQAAIQAQRRKYLSAEVDQAFFAAQDQWHDYGLSRLEVLTSDDISAGEKAERLGALRNNLPEGMRADVDAVLQYQDLQALTHELTQQGASEADIRVLREQVVGAEAADRLQALEQERAAFSARVDQWLVQRDAILGNESLALPDRLAQVEQLRAQQFSDAEQLRVESLEAVHDRSTGP